MIRGTRAEGALVNMLIHFENRSVNLLSDPLKCVCVCSPNTTSHARDAFYPTASHCERVLLTIETKWSPV
jgi:hypothetical protein